MSLEDLGLVEKPVRLLDLMKIGGLVGGKGKGKGAGGEGKDGFVPPVQ
jgi:hypothetical protein